MHSAFPDGSRPLAFKKANGGHDLLVSLDNSVIKLPVRCYLARCHFYSPYAERTREGGFAAQWGSASTFIPLLIYDLCHDERFVRREVASPLSLEAHGAPRGIPVIF